MGKNHLGPVEAVESCGLPRQRHVLDNAGCSARSMVVGSIQAALPCTDAALFVRVLRMQDPSAIRDGEGTEASSLHGGRAMQV